MLVDKRIWHCAVPLVYVIITLLIGMNIVCMASSDVLLRGALHGGLKPVNTRGLPNPSVLCELKRVTYSTDYYNTLHLLRVSEKNVGEVQVLLQPDNIGNNTNASPGGQKLQEYLNSASTLKVPLQKVEFSERPNDSATIVAGGSNVFYSLWTSLRDLIYLFWGSFTLNKVRHYDLPQERAVNRPTHGWKRFYIALNLYNSEKVLPFLSGALIAFIQDELGPFFDISNSVVVSVFINHSEDDTKMLIHTLLIPGLRSVGVRNIFLTGDGTCLTYMNRPRWMQRIEWMSCVRNKALEPLHIWGMRLFSPTFYNSSRRCEESGSCMSVNSYLNMTSLERYLVSKTLSGRKGVNFSHSAREWKDERVEEEEVRDDPYGDNMVVLFFNDIFFRPRDITSLLESVEEPVIASRTRPDGTLDEIFLNDPLPESERKKEKMGTTFDMACGMDFYFSFYDTWVSRDRLGNPFLPYPPYSDEPETGNAFYRIYKARDTVGGKRLAVPVKCCWNGVAAIRGRMFIAPKMTPNNEDYIKTKKRSKTNKANEDGEIENIHGSFQSSIRLWKGRRYRYTPDAHEELTKLLDAWVSDRLQFVGGGFISYPIWSKSRCKPLRSAPDIPIAAIAHRRSHPPGVLQANNPWETCSSSGKEHECEVYYRDENPAIRFRHSSIPSFGAITEKRYSMLGNTCKSSECMLICQDIIQAALLEQRVPLILMNPNVRVVYEARDFEHMSGWIHTSTFVFLHFWLCRKLMLLFGIQLPSYLGGTDGYKSSSAANDWTAGDFNRTTVISHTRSDGIIYSLLVNITQTTSMSCFFPGNEGIYIFQFYIGFSLLIVFILSIMLCYIRSQYIRYTHRQKLELYWFLYLLRTTRWRLAHAFTHTRRSLPSRILRFSVVSFRRMVSPFLSQGHSRHPLRHRKKWSPV